VSIDHTIYTSKTVEPRNKLSRIEKVSIAYLSSALISIAIAWLTNYFPNTTNLVERISFISEDKPWLAGETEPSQILGLHYFGDFQSYVTFTRISDPYLSTYADRSHLLPASRLFLYPLTIPSIEIAFAIYLFVCIALLIFTVLKVIQHLESKKSEKIPTFHKAILCLLIFVFSRPFLVDLDRGNFYTMSISMVVLSIIYFRENKKVRASAFIFLAVSIKSFLIFPLLPFLPWNKLKFLFCTAFVFIFLNFGAALTYSMGFMEVLKGVYSNQTNYLGAQFIGHVMNGGSLGSSLSRVYEYIYGTESTTSFLLNNLMLLQLLSLTYLALALLVAFISSKFELKFFFSLSLISFAPQSTGWYAMSWISYALLAYLISSKPGFEDRVFKWLILCVSWCLLIPLWIQIPVPGLRYNQQLVLPPILSLCYCLLYLGSKVLAILKKSTLKNQMISGIGSNIHR
jgi:hypothetical protein